MLIGFNEFVQYSIHLAGKITQLADHSLLSFRRRYR
jgi:hypothetical protein